MFIVRQESFLVSFRSRSDLSDNFHNTYVRHGQSDMASQTSRYSYARASRTVSFEADHAGRKLATAENKTEMASQMNRPWY